MLEFIVNKCLFQPPKCECDIPEKCEELTLNTSDGLKINALYLPAKKPRGFIVSSHGNGNCVHGWVTSEAVNLRTLFGFSVLCYDYRGYGKSEGKPTAQGIIKDGQAAVRYLCRREKIKPADLIFHGWSLGGAVSIQLAVKLKAKGLIVESSFSSVKDMAGFWGVITPDLLNSIKEIAKYKGKLLMCHGDRDTVDPFEQGLRLYESCPSEDKTFVKLKGKDHGDNYPASYRKKQQVFFDSLCK
jgi:alpha/beta superfamily hydrolase